MFSVNACEYVFFWLKSVEQKVFIYSNYFAKIQMKKFGNLKKLAVEFLKNLKEV